MTRLITNVTINHRHTVKIQLPHAGKDNALTWGNGNDLTDAVASLVLEDGAERLLSGKGSAVGMVRPGEGSLDAMEQKCNRAKTSKFSLLEMQASIMSRNAPAKHAGMQLPQSNYEQELIRTGYETQIPIWLLHT